MEVLVRHNKVENQEIQSQRELYCNDEFGAYQKATEIFDNVYSVFGKRSP